MAGFIERIWRARGRAPWIWLPLCLGCAGLSPTPAPAAEPAWSQRDTQLATQYLNILVEKPEPGRVLDLLWELYEKHGATDFLLQSITAQAQRQSHPHVLLVEAHLLRRASRGDEAKKIYEEVLQQDPKNIIALRALADLALTAEDKEPALVLLQKLIDTFPPRDPARVPVLLELGKVLAQLNRPVEAAAAWEDAAALQPGDTNLARQVAQLLLGAGQLDKALVLYRKLATTGEPAKRLDALYDLSRLEEQGDHFAKAVAALQDGLKLLHFKDARYQSFFLRLVRIHERFGQLDVLKAELLKAAQVTPAPERALYDLAKFAELTVDADERVKWLRELVRQFPQSQEYRWQLVTGLIDHEGWQEAAQWMDSQLKGDASDPVAVVLLRCNLYLRAGQTATATQRLLKLMRDTAGASNGADVEKQVFAFAREKSLDDVTEAILKARITRDPEKVEPVFELAVFYRSRQKTDEMQRILDAFVGPTSATQDPKQRARIDQVAAFLAGSNDIEAAERVARRATQMQGAGREETLRLADVLSQDPANTETQPLLEKAWAMSTDAEKRADVDERIFAILAGEAAPRLTPVNINNGEWKMPSLFTGEGFGSETPEVKVPEAVQVYALAQVSLIWLVDATDHGQKPPQWAALPGGMEQTLEQLATRLGRASEMTKPERVHRAAWWCLRADRPDVAMRMLWRLFFPAGQPIATPPIEAQKLLLDVAQTEKNSWLAIRQLRLLSQLEPSSRANYQISIARQYMEMAAGEIAAQSDEGKIGGAALDYWKLAVAEGRMPAGLAPLDSGKRPGQWDEGKPTAAWLRNQAVAVLEQILHDEPQNEAVLTALAQLYQDSGNPGKTLALWKTAAFHAGNNAEPLLERYAEALLSQRLFKEYIETGVRLLEGDNDLKRRREQWQRLLERLLWQDTQRGDLPDEDKKQRLDWMVAALKERTRMFPFDGFWHEALAAVYERANEAPKAFAEMKQAYYTSPDTPFSLEQLRTAAVKVGDLQSAIYFQKQIAAHAPAKDQGTEWRQLVAFLEQDFRMAEADQTRRRMEARFSQDSTALEELAAYYLETGQEDAARRVYRQLSTVRPWDGKIFLHLGMLERRLGDVAAAAASFRRILTLLPVTPPPANGPAERLPWPILPSVARTTASTGGKAINNLPPGLLDNLENVPGLEPGERDQIRVYLSLAHNELSAFPDDPAQVRLRAVEELATLPGQDRQALYRLLSQNEVKTSRMELAWAALYSGDGAKFRALMIPKLGESQSVEGSFVFVWLCLRSHGMREAVEWARQVAVKSGERSPRKAMVQAVTNLLAERAFVFNREDMEEIGSSGLLSNLELIDIAKKLESSHHDELALVLGEAAMRNASSFEAEYALFLAPIAEAAGRTQEQRELLGEVWAKAPRPGKATIAPDPYVDAFGKLWRLAATPADREKLLKEGWSRLRMLPPSGQGSVRLARIMARAGARQAGANQLAHFFAGPFLANRPYAEPLMGHSLPGTASASRIDEVTHMSNYWEECREWDGILAGQDGLAPLLGRIDGVVERRNGGVPQGARSNFEYTSWRNQALLRRLRLVPYAERIRLLRELIESDDQADTLVDLGSQLEAQGFEREAIEVYRRLPSRAPSNAEYCDNFVRACDRSWEVGPSIPYIEGLFDPLTDPVLKPLNFPFEHLREIHAHFIGLLGDVAKLRALGYPATPVRVKQGRIPEEVPYLKELGLKLSERGDLPGALAAWEQIHQIWKHDASSWRIDSEVLFQRATALTRQGNHERALEAWREILAQPEWNEITHKSLAPYAELAADTGHWAEVRELMNATSGLSGHGPNQGPTVEGALSVADVLARHGRLLEAQSLLIRVERATHDSPGRFRLRLGQLQLAAQDPQWSPLKAEDRLNVCLTTDTDDADSLDTMVAWLRKEAAGPRGAAWVQALRARAPLNDLRAVALSAFAPLLQAEEMALLEAPWPMEKDPTHAAQLLVVRALLEENFADEARRVAQSGAYAAVVHSPIMLRVLAALGDTHALEDEFSRLVRLSFPGGSNCVAYAETLAEVGRADWAAELYRLALERSHATGQPTVKLVPSYATFLIQQRRFEEAEALLLQDGPGMTQELAQLLADLYQAWGKLPRFEEELRKFDLPDGVAAQARFLASQMARS